MLIFYGAILIKTTKHLWVQNDHLTLDTFLKWSPKWGLFCCILAPQKLCISEMPEKHPNKKGGTKNPQGAPSFLRPVFESS